MSCPATPAESVLTVKGDNSEEKSNEKRTVDYNASSTGVVDIDSESLDELKALEKRLVRKVDIRMSILVLIYIMNYIDRANAASARLRGFEEDLGLHGNQFATVLAIYFVGYILMQVPSNMFMSYVKKPSLYLPGSMTTWGVISSLTGITQSYTGVVVCRFFLGFVEAAFFPGAMLLLSRWYKRDEMGLRTCILFCGLLISIGWGSLFASAILSNMEGKLGHAAWRWLYYIEGAMTVAIAILAIFVLPDFPENESTLKWLTPAEQSLAIQRMRSDAVSGSNDPNSTSQLAGLKAALGDWKVWWLAMIYAILLLAVSFNVYFPTLTSTMGYSRTISLVLCAPPSVLVSILAFFYSRHSDKHKERFWHISAFLGVAVVGYIILMTTMNTAARYVGIILIGQTPASYIVFLAWISNSFYETPAKRSAALAFTSAFAQLGAVAGSYIYPKSWGPSYRISFGISLGATVLMFLMCWFYKIQLARLNKKFEEEEEARGEKEPGFRYIL